MYEHPSRTVSHGEKLEIRGGDTEMKEETKE